MQGPSPSANQSASFFEHALHHSGHLSTPKRVGYSLAGAFVFATAAAAMSSGVASNGADSTKSQNFNVQASTDSTTPPESASGSVSDSGATSQTTFSTNTTGPGTTKVQLNVNGQDIPVPQNGSTSQTITNSNGSTTTVDVHGNTTIQGGASNQSVSNFSLNVNSNSQTSGGTSTSQ